MVVASRILELFAELDLSHTASLFADKATERELKWQREQIRAKLRLLFRHVPDERFTRTLATVVAGRIKQHETTNNVRNV